GNAAAFEVENGRAAVLEVRGERTKDAGTCGNANDCLAGDVEQRVEPVAGEPTEEAAAAGRGIEQVVIGSAAGNVAGGKCHLDADELAERLLLHHALEAIGDVV